MEKLKVMAYLVACASSFALTGQAIGSDSVTVINHGEVNLKYLGLHAKITAIHVRGKWTSVSPVLQTEVSGTKYIRLYTCGGSFSGQIILYDGMGSKHELKVESTGCVQPSTSFPTSGSGPNDEEMANAKGKINSYFDGLPVDTDRLYSAIKFATTCKPDNTDTFPSETLWKGNTGYHPYSLNGMRVHSEHDIGVPGTLAKLEYNYETESWGSTISGNRMTIVTTETTDFTVDYQ